MAVLGNVSDLSESECRELFQALDKDGNGKLSVSEFVEYVFQGQKHVTGTGLEDHLAKQAAMPEAEEEGIFAKVGSFFGF